MLNFKAWFIKDNLIDIPISNEVFAWNNRGVGFSNIAERLDIFILKRDLISFNHPFNTIILPNIGFDHYLVRLEIGEPQKPSRNPLSVNTYGFYANTELFSGLLKYGRFFLRIVAFAAIARVQSLTLLPFAASASPAPDASPCPISLMTRLTA